MPNVDTLVDDFNDNVIGAQWANSYGGVSETGGRARVPCAATTYAAYQSLPSWTLNSSSFFVEVPTLPAPRGAAECYVTVQFVRSTGAEGSAVGVQFNVVTNTIRFQNNVDYWDDNAVEMTYSATNHRWIRIRDVGTSLYWDTSPNGTTWTQRRTMTTPSWVNSATTGVIEMLAYRTSGTTDYAELNNFNIIAADTIPDTGFLKPWNGSDWAKKPVKAWNGTAWQIKPAKRWTGSTWTPT